jgi:hypothetical protein
VLSDPLLALHYIAHRKAFCFRVSDKFFGLGAAAVTYAIGSLIGVSLWIN